MHFSEACKSQKNQGHNSDVLSFFKSTAASFLGYDHQKFFTVNHTVDHGNPTIIKVGHSYLQVATDYTEYFFKFQQLV
jgi:hypothetical protein